MGNDLLFRVRNNSLNINIKAIISNHEVARKIAEFSNIPFHYLPVDKNNKVQQEQKIKEILYDNNIELIVLARYMQVLSESFERGVKVIGATAHYVTKELGEGPIIEQDTQEVDHEMMPDDLISIGRDIESRVLYRALKAHSEKRVFLNGKRTIVFKGHRKVV